jgi:hypothetical protein
MKSVISNYLEQAKVAKAQIHLNLAMFPLLSDYPAKTEYLVLDEALVHGVVEIGEVGEAGTVPRLFLKNRSAVKRFLSDTAKAACEMRPSVALGTDVRVESARVHGLALLHGGELLHLSAFKKASRRKERAA